MVTKALPRSDQPFDDQQRVFDTLPLHYRVASIIYVPEVHGMDEDRGAATAAVARIRSFLTTHSAAAWFILISFGLYCHPRQYHLHCMRYPRTSNVLRVLNILVSSLLVSASSVSITFHEQY